MNKIDKRIKEKKEKVLEFILKGNKEKDAMQLTGWGDNIISEQLMFRKATTENIVSTYKEKIGDNEKNLELIVDAMSSENGGLYLFEAQCSAGKTYTSNDTFNKIRDTKNKEDMSRIESGAKELYKNKFFRELALTELNQINKRFYELERKSIIEMCDRRIAKAKASITDKKELAAEIESIMENEKEQLAETVLETVSELQYSDFVLFIDKKVSTYKNEKTVRFVKGTETEVEELKSFIIKCADERVALFEAIITPQRIQNEQNESEENYTFKSIIGANGTTINLSDETNYSVVIEKIKDAYETVKRDNDKARINIIVDEAHILVQQKNFRNKAINSLLEVIAEIVKSGGNVIFMTGTTENLKCFKFDKIISVIPEEEKKNADKILIYANRDSEVKNFDYLVSCLKEIEKPLARYNSKNGMMEVKNVLEALDNKVFTLSADDKGKDKKTGIYFNEVFGNIVNKSALVNADVVLTTSIIDVGTNIKGVLIDIEIEDPETHEKIKKEVIKQITITPTYVINDYRNCNIDSMVQFCARIRYKVSNYAFITKYSEKEGKLKIIPVSWFLEKEIAAVEKAKRKFEANLKFYKTEGYSEEDTVLNIESDIASSIYVDKTKVNNNCIFYNRETGEIEVDLISLYKNAYDDYNQQFYYDTRLLKIKLEEELGLPAEFVNPVSVSSYTKTGNEITKDAKENSKRILDILSADELEILNKVICDDMDLSEVKDTDLKRMISTVYLSSQVVGFIKKANDLLVPIQEIAAVIVSSKKDVEVLNWLEEYFYIKSNKQFLKSNSAKSIEQEITLKKFYEVDKSGKMKQKYIDIRDVVELANDFQVATGKKQTTVKDVYDLIFKVFTVQDLEAANIEKRKNIISAEKEELVSITEAVEKLEKEKADLLLQQEELVRKGALDTDIKSVKKEVAEKNKAIREISKQKKAHKDTIKKNLSENREAEKIENKKLRILDLRKTINKPALQSEEIRLIKRMEYDAEIIAEKAQKESELNEIRLQEEKKAQAELKAAQEEREQKRREAQKQKAIDNRERAELSRQRMDARMSTYSPEKQMKILKIREKFDLTKAE